MQLGTGLRSITSHIDVVQGRWYACSPTGHGHKEATPEVGSTHWHIVIRCIRSRSDVSKSAACLHVGGSVPRSDHFTFSTLKLFPTIATGKYNWCCERKLLSTTGSESSKKRLFFFVSLSLSLSVCRMHHNFHLRDLVGGVELDYGLDYRNPSAST